MSNNDFPDFSAFAVGGDEDGLPDFSDQAVGPKAPDLPIPQKYYDAIKRLEGFTPNAAWDYKQNTNGFGTRALHPGERIDEAEAERRYNREISKAAASVDAFLPGLPEGVRASLASLTFNSGDKWQRMGLGAALKAGDMEEAGRRFNQYVNAGGKPLGGLINRRAEEYQWWREHQTSDFDSNPETDNPDLKALLSAPPEKRRELLIDEIENITGADMSAYRQPKPAKATPEAPKLDFSKFAVDPAKAEAQPEEKKTLPFGMEQRSKLLPGEDKYFKANPGMAAMAAEDGKVILNPYSKAKPQEQEAAVRNETARLFMRNTEIKPSFELTKEQRAQFAGTPYANDEQAMRETIAARIFSNDPSAKTATPEQKDFVAKNLAPVSETGSLGYGEELLRSIKRGTSMFGQQIDAFTAMRTVSELNRVRTIEERIAKGNVKFTKLEDIVFASLRPEARKKYIDDLEGRLATDVKSIAERAPKIESIPPSPIVTKALNAKSFSEFWNHFKQDPVRFIGAVGVESLPQMVPGMVAATGGGIVAGVPGAIAGMGLGSFGTDFMGEILGGLSSEGVNIKDPAAVEAALKDPKIMAKLKERAGLHAVVVGALDAVSAGVASKTLVPKILAKTPIAREVTNIVAQLPVQGALGAAGEVGGSVASGQEVQPGQVGAEFFGEFIGAPAEVAGIRSAVREAKEGNDGAKPPAPPPVPQSPPQPGAHQIQAPAAAAPAPARSPTPSEPAGEITPDDIQLLIERGWKPDALLEMGEEELRAEVEDARAQVGTPLAPNAPRQADFPSAEPVSDIEAQILSMRAGERDGVYLSADNVENLQSQPEFVNRIAEALNSVDGAKIVQNVDGKGGIMVAANADVARNIEKAVKSGVDVQTVLGEATGAGTGKAVDATAVVQQKTPEGAVTRESLVTPDQVAETEKEFAQPGKTVETVTPEQAIARREEKIAEEKQTGPKQAGPMVSRVPTFKDIAETLPKDKDGDPDYKALSDRIADMGKKGWPDLNVMEKAKLYREFAGQGTGTRNAPVAVETADDLDFVSHEADSEYTPAQGEANNRKLGHAKWNGLDLSIETKAGGVRKGVDKKTGKTWETTMGAAYGYIRGTSGADNMHVDVFVGPDVNSDRVFVIDEVDNRTGKFRQHKTFVGFPDEESAIGAYTRTSSKTPDMIGAVTEMSADDFRDWVLDGKKTEPLGNIEKPDFSALALESESPAKPAEPASETIAPPARYDGEPLSEMEIDAIVGNWKYVQEVSRRPRPQSLSSYVIDNGGLRDDAREVRHIAGSAKERPGLVNAKGQTLDDAALSALEAGFFHGDRPDIADFLDALQNDLHSGKVVREQDLPALDDLRIAEDIAQELADYGVTTNRFRSEASLRKYFGQERPRTTRETEAAEETQTPAKERPSRTGDVEEAPFDLPAKAEKAKKPFDPYKFSVQAVYAKQGEEALKKRLAEFGIDELKQIVSAQNLGVNASVLDGGNAIALRKAIVEAAREKLANRMAAAGGTVEGALKKPGNAGVQEKPYELANDAKAPEVSQSGTKGEPVVGKDVTKGGELLIGSGDILRSKSGRELSPVPKIDLANNRKTINSSARMNKWLLEEAKNEVEASREGAFDGGRGADYLETMLAAINLKNLSQSDKDTMNLILFDDADGAKWEHLVRRGDEAAPKPAPAKDAETAATETSNSETPVDEISKIDLANLPKGWSVDLSPTVLKGDEARQKGGAYKAIGTRQQPAGSYSVRDAFHDDPDYAQKKVLWALGYRPGITTEASGQTSLVPPPTTKEEIDAASVKKGEKPEQKPIDEGLFGSGKDQLDLVDMAKQPAKTPGQIAYEEDVRRKPTYQDGGKRPSWNQLDDAKKATWEKNPTARGEAKPEKSRAGWQEAFRDPDLVHKLDDDGDTIGAVMFDRERQKKNHDKGWAALDADGNVLGYAPTLGAAKEIVDAQEEAPAPADQAERDTDAASIDKPGSKDKSVLNPAGEPAATAEPVEKPVAKTETAETKPQEAVSLQDALRDRLLGEGFATIIEARKFAKEHGFEGSTKDVDELVEQAVVAAARQVASETGDSKSAYQALVGLYSNQPNLAVRTSTSVTNQAYSTPAPLAYLASRLADVANASHVLEPTAGNGMLLIEADPNAVEANEIDPKRAKALRDQNFATVKSVDATDPAFTQAKSADSVIMNPPFGAVREDGQSKSWTVDGLETSAIDHAIALNALHAMTDDGKAVIIMGGVNAESIEERRKGYRGKSKRLFFAKLYKTYNVTDHFTVSGDLYKKQGAGWPVDVVVIAGRGQSERPLPASEPPVILKSWEDLKGKLPDVNVSTQGSRKAPVGDRRQTNESDRGKRGSEGGNGPRSKDAGGRGTERLPGGTENKPADVRGNRDSGKSADVRDRTRHENRPAPESDRNAGTVNQPAAPRKPRLERTPPPEGSGQALYEPASDAQSLNTLIPVNMQQATQAALRRIEKDKGNLDQYVADNLGYDVNELSKYFSAEQVDAIASAISNIEKGSAQIIGDQTGIGKGRVVAATIRYAIRKGWTPIFVTEKIDLYGDMFRDMADIGLPKMLGHEPRAFMTNTGESVPLDEEALAWKQEADQARADDQPIPKRRGRFLTAGGKPAQDMAMAAIVSGKGEYDIVFTTYDQMNPLKKQETDRRHFLRQINPNSLLILDESHVAGGQGEKKFKPKHGTAPDRAEFVRGLVKDAAGVVYSSATYAKRPDVMDLYARTDMGKAVDDPKLLPALIQKGGVPMQQIVASMLSNAGQYMRRERSFEGVEYAIEPVPVDEKTYKQFTDAVRSVFEFDLAVEDIRDEVMKDILDKMGATKAKDAGVGSGSASSTAFASIMHNIVNQMLLSIKARQVAQRAIDAHKAGEKPVIALASTMEKFISDYAEDAGIAVGQNIDITFGDVLAKYLSRTLRITVKDSENKTRHVQIPLSDLPPSLQRKYAEAEQLIKDGDFDLMPASPIDAIRHELTRAGLKVAEVTGRKKMIDYAAGNMPRLVDRPKSEMGPAGKRSSIAAFNRGGLDALILNRSGSTGVSMHASKAFKDQSPRRMIIAQAEANIDTHLQMLGRVHRTGQVIPPSYSQIAAEIPAEARPTAVLMKKMASLNANTTGARGSVFMADAVDFMNEYGDKVVANIINDDPEINAKLGSPLKENDKGLPVSEDAARNVTGRLVLLSPQEQTDLLNRIQDEYKAEIERLDALGENALEAKTVDLRAKVLDTTTLKDKTGEGPFLDSAQIEKVSVKAQGRAMAPGEVVEAVAKGQSITSPDGEAVTKMTILERSGRDWMNKKIGDVRSRSQSWIAADVAAKSDDAKVSTKKRHDDQLTRWIQTAQVVAPGARVTLQLGDRQMQGIVLSVERTGKAKNPVALGAWTATVAVPDSVRTISMPFSQLFPPSHAKGGEESGAEVKVSQVPFSGIISQLEDARREGREERYIVTGNILAGYDQVHGKGQIVNFTMEDGTLRPGILMSRDFQLNKFMNVRTVRFKTAAQVATFLEKAPMAEVQTSDKYVRFVRPRGEYVIETAAGRATGGQYYTDTRVRDALKGREFVRSGGVMRVTMSDRAAFERVVEAIRKVGGIFETTSDQDLAQEIIRQTSPLSALGGDHDPQAINNIERRLVVGREARIAPSAVQFALEAIKNDLKLAPANTIVAAVSKIATDAEHDGHVLITATKHDGKTVTARLPWDRVKDSRAIFIPGRRPTILHINFRTPPESARRVQEVGQVTGRGALDEVAEMRFALAESIRADFIHELTHLLRTTGVLTGSRWQRLLDHANSLQLLELDVNAPVSERIMLRELGVEPRQTLRDAYSRIYAHYSNAQEAVDQEAVAALREMAWLGLLSDEQLAPVRDILDEISDGNIRGLGFNESGGPAYAIGKSQSDQDALGYTSALLRGAYNLKQEKGTPEQMLAQLKDVKEAEIEATGLRAFLEGKKSVTKSEIIKHVSDNRVQLREVFYQGEEYRDIEGMGGGIVDDEAMAGLFGEPEPVVVQKGPKGAKGPARWLKHSVDPKNPTSRETVVYLPEKTSNDWEARRAPEGGWAIINKKTGERHAPEIGIYDLETAEDMASGLNVEIGFHAGHYPEPNIIGHMRTQILTDEQGRKYLNGDEFQSDMAQAIRDQGTRDDAKIESLKLRKSLLDSQVAHLKPLAARDGENIDQQGIEREFVISNWRGESDQGLKYALEDWAASGVEIGEDAKAYIEAVEERTLVEAELQTAQAVPVGHPLVNTTEQWLTTTFRRFIRRAAELGVDYVSITPGRIQAARYNLAKDVRSLEYDPTKERLYIEATTGSPLGRDAKQVRSQQELEKYVGKEAARMLLEEPRGTNGAKSTAHKIVFKDGQVVGGEGMKATYDVMYPRLMGKLLAKMDPTIKAKKTNLFRHDGTPIRAPLSAKEVVAMGLSAPPAEDFVAFPITQQVRSQVLNDGQPMFAIGGRGKGDPVSRYIRWAEKAKPATLSITDKIGKAYRFERQPLGNGSIYYKAFDGAKEVASFYVRTGGAIFDSISVMNAIVERPYRRLGLASAAYDAIEADTAPGGLPLYPQGTLSMSQDAKAFWETRNPERLREMERAELDRYSWSAAQLYQSKIDNTAKANVETAIKDALEIVGRIAGRNISVDLKPTIPVSQALSASSRADLEASGLELPETAGGYYRTVRNDATGVIEGPHVIGLAFDDPRFDLRTTSGHEAWHHVETVLANEQEKRLLQSPSEMARMTRRAAKEAGRSTAETSRLPAYEIRALAFQNYRRMREEGAAELSGLHIGVRRFFERVAKTLAAVRNALNGMGYTTFEDIFERARTGETAAKAARQEAGAKEQKIARVLMSVMQSSSNNNPDPAATINAFIDQRMARDDSNRASQAQAYHAYALWADEAGLELPTIEEFDKAMIRQGVRRMMLAGDVRYVGLRVVDESEEKPANPNARIEKDAFQIAKELALGRPLEDAINTQIEKVKSVIGEKPDFARLAMLQALKANDNANEQIHQNVVSIMGNVIPTAPVRSTLERRVRRMLSGLSEISDAARVRIQDKALPIRRIAVERVENETGAAVPVSLDTYISEGLYHGRAGERLNDLKQDRIEPLLEHMRASGLTLESVGDYLYARHAFERNDAIRQIDPDNDAGSGMTDEEAATILDRVYQSGKQADMDTAVRMVDTIIDDARNTLLRSGLIDRTTYDKWREKYPNYVPLRGFELGEDENPDRPRAGRGFDLRGPESRRALGRRSKADNPLVYTIMQAQESIIRAEKNRVAKTLYRMIEANPNPAVWELYRGEAKRRVNPSTGLVETYWVRPPFVHNDAVHGVKFNGKQFWMELKNPALARAMRGVGSEWNGSIIGRAMMTLTRTYASLLTSYNPGFVVSNFFRDLETSLMNVSDVANKPAGLRRQILKDATSLKSIRGALAAVRDHEGRTIFGTHRRADENILGLPKSAGAQEYAQWYDEFRLAGGKISFMEFNDVERIKHRINSDLKAGRMKRALRGAAEYVENLNTAVENGVRLSTYVALRRSGVHQDKAAFTARELTVNFNRRGELGPVINSMYLFFNASVQGSTRVAQAFVRSKAVRYGVAGIFAAGLSLDLFNFLVAGDGDDGENKYDAIPDWIKERNVIIMDPFGGDYIMIPMAYGYNIPHLGGIKAMQMLRGKTSPLEAAGAVAGQVIDAFNPLGTSESFYQLVSPTVLDPAVQVLENKTWYGGPIYPTLHDKRKPESENYFTSAPWWAVGMAKTLNSMSGGNSRRPGWFDVSPEVIEHYAEFAGGGVAKFVANAINSGERLISGDEWLPEKTPFLRRVYGRPTSEGRKRDFYEMWDEVNQAHYEAVGLAKDGDREGARAAREKYAAELRVYGAAKGAKKTLKALRGQRDRIKADGKLDHAERQAKLNDIIEREKALISRVMKLYRDAKSKQTEKETAQ